MTKQSLLTAGLGLALCFLALPGAAEISEPHHVLYGRASIGGIPVEPGTPITLEVEGQQIASFLYGSNPEAPELYILRAPLDTVGERPPGVARRGDRAEVYIAGQLASLTVIGAAGTAQNLDIDPDFLAAAIFISDLELFEGQAGTRTATLAVSINQTSASDVEVDFTTRDGSAESSSDYIPLLGRVTIPAGETSVPLEIEISGDTSPESDEEFFVDLSNPLNGVLFDPEGKVTIRDDDTPPGLSVGDVALSEPNPGATQDGSFRVAVSHAWHQDVSFDYAAVDLPGEAINGTDYVLAAGSLTIPAGQLTTEIPFTLLGDVEDEADEIFQVQLSGPVNASLADGVGQATLSDFIRFLRYLEHQADTDAAEAGGNGTVSGLAAAYDVDISPDGQNVYVAGRGSDAVVAFTRAADGTLTHLATYSDGENGVAGLNGVEAVRVSGDGTKVFAAAFDNNAVVSFLRQGDGSLVYADHDLDGQLDPESTRTVEGLAGATALAEAPRGTPEQADHLYVAGLLDDAVSVFSVRPDGKLEYETVVRDGLAGVDGLAQASAVAVGPGGTQVYVTGFLDDAVSVFNRNPADGFLTYRETHRNAEAGVFGIDGAIDLTLTADGTFLYAAGMLSSGVAVFSRNTQNGLLTFQSSVFDGVGGVEGLGFVTGVGLSKIPDLGELLFATSFSDDAVTVFERLGDGSLDFLDFVRDGLGGTDGIDGANALVVSGDDQNVYVAGSSESALAVFGRDIVAPDPLALTSPSHSVGVPSNLTTVGLQWSGASDVGFGVGEYWLLLDTEAGTVAPVGPPSLRVPHGADPHTAELGAGADAEGYYAHVTTCDLIGNCSPTHLGPFPIDTMPPSAVPDLASPSHETPNTDPRITTTWSAADDPPAAGGYASGLAGYSWAYLETDVPECDAAAEATELTTTSPILAVGTWFFHLCAVDVAGNTGPVAVSPPLVIAPDLEAPSVQVIDSVARTAGGEIDPGEQIDLAVTQLLVAFSESIGTGVADPASYRLVEAGNDGEPSLETCDGTLGDDQEVTIAAVVYFDDDHTAFLDLASSDSLAAGSYRLLVCSTLADLQGNLLDDGNDHRLDFSTAANFLANPNFDTDIAQWERSDPAVAAFATDDADGVPTSGSLEILVNDQEESIGQCLDLTGFPTAAEVALAARARIVQRTETVVRVAGEVRFFDQPACAGTELEVRTTAEVSDDTEGAWLPLQVGGGPPPAGAVSARVELAATPDDLAGDASVGLDSGSLLALLPFFADGFESGDATSWSRIETP